MTAQTFGNPPVSASPRRRTGSAGETASFDAATGRAVQILAGTSNSIASFSYSWDSVGNLVSRADTYQGYTEQFCYDALNRLVNSAFGASCTGGKTVGYDSLGNILSKSDVGTYLYPAAGQARPHAVSSITGTVNGVLNPAFAYDANGNMTAGAGRSIAWTSFNLAAQVTQGTTTVAFQYDSGHQRIVQTIGGASPSTTAYLNAMGAVSEKFVAGSTATWHDYIYAAGSLVAERFCSGASPCTTGAQMRYAVSDHLSSPSSLTDETGAVTERLSYDAWGMRRNANGTDALCGAVTSVTTRGFTGHETVDAVCLVNMNARLYDPAIGRFMSADSIVPNPFDGQSFNRYAYVVNNPLRYVDPSGHDDIEEVIVTALRPKQDGYPTVTVEVLGGDGAELTRNLQNEQNRTDSTERTERGDGDRPDKNKKDDKKKDKDKAKKFVRCLLSSPFVAGGEFSLGYQAALKLGIPFAKGGGKIDLGSVRFGIDNAQGLFAVVTQSIAVTGQLGIKNVGVGGTFGFGREGDNMFLPSLLDDNTTFFPAHSIEDDLVGFRLSGALAVGFDIKLGFHEADVQRCLAEAGS